MAEDAEPCRARRSTAGQHLSRRHALRAKPGRPQPPARRVHRGRAHRIRHRGPGADALPAGLSGLMGLDPVKLGFGFLGGPDLRSVVDIGTAAEQAGFDSLWHAEARITRDSVTGTTGPAT